MITPRLTYVTDRKRHLICVPYSIENLHQMAIELGIKRCWFHKNHYDIPLKRVDEIEKRCTIVTSVEIVEIIRSPQYGETIISKEILNRGAAPPDYMEKMDSQYLGTGKNQFKINKQLIK